jgi:signal transduction histidine kinase
MRSLTSLRTKLTVLVATPLVVLVALATVNLGHAGRSAHRRADAAEQIELSVAATTAARQLAQERGLSATALAGGTAGDGTATTGDGGSAAPSSEALTFQRGQTTDAVDRLESVLADDGSGRDASAPVLDGLRELRTTRDDVDRGAATSDEVLGAYAEIIDPVLELGPTDTGGTGGDPAVATGLSAFNALSRGIQEVALEQSLIAAALDSGTIDSATYQRLLGTVSNQGVWFDLFQRSATPSQLDAFGEAQALPSMATAQGLREAALAAGPGGPVDGNAEIWASAMGRKLDLLDALADDSAADLAARARSASDAAANHRTIALLQLLAVILFAAALVLVLHRLVGVRLRRLVGATRHAADEGLPEVVEIAQLDGADVARRALRPLPRSGTTELDEIAGAVDTLQATAVDLASEGAVLRGNVHSVFLNFGTRTQNLVTRQLGHIDDLEARTDDPDTLSDLFLLDHLATRLRRNAETLVVMAGAESPRPWARPVSVVNVVRAAAAEAADYSRVDVEPMAPAAVLGASANDVSHLLAELLDNALAFSPPESRVVVGGRWQRDGRYLVNVSDAGMGMSAAQLAEANRRITELPVAEAEMADFFGLFVVGRFARRHDIEVRLAPSPSDGVTAEVLLPETLLAGPDAVAAASGAGADAGAGPGAGADGAAAGGAADPSATTVLPVIRPAPPVPRDHHDATPATATAPGRPPLRPATPIPSLVPVPTDADRRRHRDDDTHAAQPRWLRRRVRKPAGTRDDVTPPVASDPTTPPTMVGRGDD